MFVRALISVSDKSNLEALLEKLPPEVEILSTGGTAERIRACGKEVTDIAAFTGTPEAFGGRLKTLHPRVHGGILYRRGRDEAEAERLGIVPIDLVVVNLYPFLETYGSGAEGQELIEQIDIGGPTLLRAAAKNADQVVVLCRPEDYDAVLEEASTGAVSSETRQRLRAVAFAHTARYDAQIAAALTDERFPESLCLPLERRALLRYGENPHQDAALYRSAFSRGELADFEQLNGQELSYNNLLDLAGAHLPLKDLAGGQVMCCVVKHAAPCGLAVAPTVSEALQRAWEGDPVSAFGSVLAFSAPVDGATAEYLAAGRFVEVISAPDYTPEALESLTVKAKLRVLRYQPAKVLRTPASFANQAMVQDGLALLQTPDHGPVKRLTSSTRKSFPASAEGLARFAMTAVRCLKSNAIAVAREVSPGCYQTIGLCGGQPNRVDSVRLALSRAQNITGGDLTGAVLASDAFFPFPDSIELAAAAGVTLVVQPGGSIKDPDVIGACDRYGVAMAFTGVRAFRH